MSRFSFREVVVPQTPDIQVQAVSAKARGAARPLLRCRAARQVLSSRQEALDVKIKSSLIASYSLILKMALLSRD
jgi:hypothetical protein